MSRKYDAYLAPAGIILGLALHDVFGSLLFLIGLNNKKTALWRLSLIGWFTVSLFVLVQLISVDYLTSPYMAVVGYIGYLYMANYIVNFLTTIIITILFLMRIRMFFGKNSTFYYSMICTGGVVILAKGVGNAIGLVVSYDYAIYNNKTETHPLYSSIALMMAIAVSIEGVFSAVGSISFLYYLIGSDYTPDWNGIRSKLFRREGSRLSIIICAYAVIVYMAVWVVFDDNYVSHTGFFLQSLAYALELYTFLHISYNSPKTIISELTTSKDLVYSTDYSSQYNSRDRPTPIDTNEYIDSVEPAYRSSSPREKILTSAYQVEQRSPRHPVFRANEYSYGQYRPSDERPIVQDTNSGYRRSPIIPEKAYKYFPERSRSDSQGSIDQKFLKTYRTSPVISHHRDSRSM